MIVKCVVACHNAQGEPDFFFVKIQCSEDEYESGTHYERAKIIAIEEGYEGEFVVFDESDGPLWLFQKFNWKSASVR
jgi:hypothetical protein